MASSDNEVNVMVQNPSYSALPQVISPQKRGRGSIIIFGGTDVIGAQPTAAGGAGVEEFEKIGSSSKWDHHITAALVATIVAALCLNPCALACGIASIYFSMTARIASRNDKYDEKLDNQRTAFAFFIVCIITLIISVCLLGFTLYESLCGRTGVKCTF